VTKISAGDVRRTGASVMGKRMFNAGDGFDA